MVVSQQILHGTVGAQPAKHLWLPAPSAQVYSCRNAQSEPPHRHMVAAATGGNKQKQQAADRRADPPRLDSASAADEQTGWLWRRDAGSTQKQLKAERLRPKKCAPRHASLACSTYGTVQQQAPPMRVCRSMGQNFVTKDDILAAIVRAAGVVAGRTVLEIGPGTGNLTKHLLLAGANVVAVEKDDTLFARLQEEFKQVWCANFRTVKPLSACCAVQTLGIRAGAGITRAEDQLLSRGCGRLTT